MSRFKLPLENGSWKLTLDTLNRHSGFRKPRRSYFAVKIRHISFQNEILLLGISLANEAEEKVYIQVRSDHLLVGCSVDTDESYLSRYAYHTLEELMYINEYYDFERFYWPGFFNAKTGRSKYLQIINDRSGMDIRLKSSYPSFYKPGQKLIYPIVTAKSAPAPMAETTAAAPFPADGRGIGYCIADTYATFMHSNHWPFLVPYTFISKNNGKEIKSFSDFIRDEADLPLLDYPAIQAELNGICYRMKLLASIVPTSTYHAESKNQKIRCENSKNRDELFLLWQKALPKIQCQQFTHHLHTYGMKNIRGKPMRKHMQACVFSIKTPRLCFSWRDKGDYFVLKLLFKIDKKTLAPSIDNTTFFVNSSDDPMTFYLLGSLQDLNVLSLFAPYKFCLAVFKSHYDGYFKPFKEQLAHAYEFI